ncbi:uncharacterized protein F4817DRAFT_334778 [Daldinia loculata]|uniref:uncharacterized protein n=1 Tax=Daldinia loculata TaxID=103429 RepID=UPI0020C56368|nr:uncharacterized protein F4817DRAFT_334778 [Daldinia loculata]KAI1648371.1 hypothetical protein F4817DRAFT_334778 [Daldinia loculata]
MVNVMLPFLLHYIVLVNCEMTSIMISSHTLSYSEYSVIYPVRPKSYRIKLLIYQIPCEQGYHRIDKISPL